MSKILLMTACGLLFSANTAMAINGPPNGFNGQIWTSGTGCKYTRAGRPGETIWYLILNSRKGRDCDITIVPTDS